MSDTAVQQAQAYIDAHPFFMISKLWCPDCHYAYRVFDEQGVRSKIHVLELDKLEDQAAAVELESGFTAIAGRKWVPTIWFNGKVFGNEQDLKRLVAAGTVGQAFKDAGL